MNHKGLQDCFILVAMWVFLQSATCRATICSLSSSLKITQLNETRGRFYSPNYPSTYPDNTSQTWSITMATDVRIQLYIFIDELQARRQGNQTECLDSIEILEQGSEDPVMRTCGRHKVSSFLSRGANLSVQFTSDCSAGFKGFRAVFSAFKDICPEGWFYFDSSCYRVFKSKITWPNAHEACREMNGDLVSIINADEQELISGMTSWNREEHYWIGLHDDEREGEYRWSDGSLFYYNNWKNLEPNDDLGREDCVEIASKNPKWNDDDCQKHYGFICKTSRAPTIDARRWFLYANPIHLVNIVILSIRLT